MLVSTSIPLSSYVLDGDQIPQKYHENNNDVLILISYSYYIDSYYFDILILIDENLLYHTAGCSNVSVCGLK